MGVIDFCFLGLIRMKSLHTEMKPVEHLEEFFINYIRAICLLLVDLDLQDNMCIFRVIFLTDNRIETKSSNIVI